jgi:hypothetical protein
MNSNFIVKLTTTRPCVGVHVYSHSLENSMVTNESKLNFYLHAFLCTKHALRITVDNTMTIDDNEKNYLSTAEKLVLDTGVQPTFD